MNACSINFAPLKEKDEFCNSLPWATAEGAVCKQARERSNLRDQASCGLERSYLRMSVLAFERAFLERHFL
jgi:hypothetical protein